MQALLLAGGEGTRLRPLTSTVPKPVLPLAGRPFLTFMLDWLAGHGVDEAILSCGFLADRVKAVLGQEHGAMRLRYVNEAQPLGTAGPVRLAAEEGVLADRLFVLNADVLTDLDLGALMARHECSPATATIALVAVPDSSSYGVVPTAADGRVEAFLEKQPGPAPTNRVNAGCYVLERGAVEEIPAGRAVSFEREVFPALVGRGELYAELSEGYWNDIGTPARYLEATRDLLEGTVSSTLPERTADGSLVAADVAAQGAEVGPFAVLGAGAALGAGTRVRHSVLFDRVRAGVDCTLDEAIVGADVVLRDGASVAPGAVLGAGAEVGEGAHVGPGARIAPGERVPPGAERSAQAAPAGAR